MTPSRVLVRSGILAAVVVGGEVAVEVAGHSRKTVGANIGPGLLIFLVLAVVASGLGLVNGRRHTARGVLMLWLVVSAIVGTVAALSVSVSGWLSSGGFSASVLLSDLLMLAPFMAGLIVVHVLIGAAVGEATAAGRGAPAPRRTAET